MYAAYEGMNAHVRALSTTIYLTRLFLPRSQAEAAEAAAGHLITGGVVPASTSSTALPSVMILKGLGKWEEEWREVWERREDGKSLFSP